MSDVLRMPNDERVAHLVALIHSLVASGYHGDVEIVFHGGEIKRVLYPNVVQFGEPTNVPLDKRRKTQ